MTHTLRTALAISLLSILVPSAAAAQAHRAPEAKDFALNVNGGFARAFDDDFDDLEPIVNLAAEFYIIPEVSLRAMVGFTSFDAEIDGRDNEADVAFATAGATYNWLSGPVHPFVAANMGLYDRDFDGPDVARSDEGIELGFNAGGGADFFFGSHWALRLEGLFHGLAGDEPDTFLSITAGVKYRF